MQQVLDDLGGNDDFLVLGACVGHTRMLFGVCHGALLSAGDLAGSDLVAVGDGSLLWLGLAQAQDCGVSLRETHNACGACAQGPGGQAQDLAQA